VSAGETEALPAPLIIENFLDHPTCLAWCDAMRAGVVHAAQVVDAAGHSVVQTATRRSGSISLAAEACASLLARLDALRPVLADHFRTALDSMQQPEFLVYRRGDYFRPHQDNSALEVHGAQLRRRKVSAVLFFNGQARRPAERAYCGGTLRLYTASTRHEAVPYVELAGEPGSLVAFFSSVVHEVRPVIHGERFTVATWYTGPTTAETARAPMAEP
jgi:SM-20-related protein